MATGHYIGVASKKITLTNLVPAMSSLSFAVGSSSGTCEMSTAHTKYGSTALCNTGVAGYNEMYALSSQKFQLIPDHFYYACVEVYQETKLGSIDYFWPSGSPSIFGGQATGNAGAWKKLSNVTTRTSFAAGDYPIRLDFNNGGTAGKAWYDGLMLIDLTEAFGAGNEPGNAWCEANIPYFTGTTTVERYTESGVARKVVSSYIGVEGVARKVTSGYVGVNGVARLFFAPDDGGAVVLEVEKITSDTYANSTTYTAEEFILLDIYPKTGGTVKVSYGGLTKTITDTSGAKEPNAQTVFFGTLYGVSDSVATPTSGELVIKGDYTSFASGTYYKNNKNSTSCGCIKRVSNFGTIETLSEKMFKNCDSLTDIILLDDTKSIPAYAFAECDGFTSIVVPEGITDIGKGAFYLCENLVSIILPSTLKTIGSQAIWKFLNTGPAYTVTVLATTPPDFTGDDNDDTILQTTGSSKATLVVPKGCKDAYSKASGWSGSSSLSATIVEAT